MTLWYAQPMELIAQEYHQIAIKLLRVTDYVGDSIEHSLQLIGHRLWRCCIQCITLVTKACTSVAADSLSSDPLIHSPLDVPNSILNLFLLFRDHKPESLSFGDENITPVQPLELKWRQWHDYC